MRRGYDHTICNEDDRYIYIYMDTYILRYNHMKNILTPILMEENKI